MEIRRLRSGDGDRLREVRLRALADAPFAFSSSLAREREHDAEFWAGRVAESERAVDGAVYVAIDGSRSIGMAGGFFAPGQREEATLWGMWVDPGQRRRGVARMLVEAVASWAQGGGAASLRLLLTDCDRSRPAASLYAGLGFLETGEHEPLESNLSLTTRAMARAL